MRIAPRLLAAGLVGALALSTLPAQAGPLAYPDPAGDATAVDDANPPRPSDPELDLLDVSWSTTSDELVVSTTLGAIGEPVASNGWAVAHYFTYEDIRFELLVQDVGTPSSAVFSDGVYLRVAGDSSTEYPCVCRFNVEPGAARVRVHIELHSLGSAVRFIDPSTPRPGAGSTFTSLETISSRVVGFLFAADHAAPPPETIFVV